MQRLHEFLERSARNYPNKIALVCGNARLTYSEINAQANSLCQGLMSKGVSRGDRVIVWLQNSVEACISIFGILKAGAAFVIVNPTVKEDKFLYIVGNCQPRAIIAHGGFQGLARDRLWEVDEHIQIVEVGHIEPEHPRVLSFAGLISSHPPTPPKDLCIDRDLAALVYTSGSTGFPKGVMSAHYNIVGAAQSITQYLENTPEDIILNVLPLAFDYGLYQLLMTFLIGGTLILESSFTFPLKIVEAMRRENVTGFPGVPSIFSLLLKMDANLLRLPALRYISNTGAALSATNISRLQALFPHVRIYSMYGQTECKRTLYLPPEELAKRPESVGIPIPNEEVFVVDDKGREVPPGETGELIVRGANVMLGYWRNPEATRETFIQGTFPGERWLKTGDLFRRDEDGFLYFIARKDNIIKSRGQKVSPKEVEIALAKIPGVDEAAVVGMEHALWGEAVQAHVVLEKNTCLDEKALIRHARALLEDFMVPQSVVFHDMLPKTISGKIDYNSLKSRELNATTI